MSSLLGLDPDALAERFWPKVTTGHPSECWEWRGPTYVTGYGMFWLYKDGRQFPRRAHRIAWELHHGKPIPEGLVLDHLCRNRLCVNPAHLEPVTNAENVRRGKASFAFAGTCISGKHQIRSEADLRPNGPNKQTCAQCARDRAAARRELKRREQGIVWPKLTEASVIEIRSRAAAGENQAALAREFGIGYPLLWRIITYRNWKNVGPAAIGKAVDGD